MARALLLVALVSVLLADDLDDDRFDPDAEVKFQRENPKGDD